MVVVEVSNTSGVEVDEDSAVTVSRQVLAAEGVNIEMIATSEIKVSVVVNSKYGELAMRALHDAFLENGTSAGEAVTV